MTPDLSLSLSLATPELIVALGAMALLMVGVYSGERANTTVTGLSVALLIAVAAWIVFFGGDGQAFGNAFISDGFARFMKVLTLVGSVVTLIMSVGFAKAEKFDKFEYPVLIMLSTLGMMLMISANSMIALYLGLELQSLALYVVAAINRDSVRSTEAGLKYFVLGALSSGMLLYGIAGLWLHRQYRFPGDCGSARRRRAAAWPCLRPGVRAGRPCLQDLGRAVPYVDAGRL
jgi:NADH-quinone oxidoreductase subunit N